MATYTIETGDQGCTLTVDGGEPQPMESVEQACEAIEQAEGGGQDNEQAEQQGMQQGFAGARGAPL